MARVLLRVHAMKAQMAGVRGELSALQSRVNRYDGFTKGIVDRMDQEARPPAPVPCARPPAPARCSLR